MKTTRRKILQLAGLCAGAALLPRRLGAANAPTTTPAGSANSAIYRFRIGAIEATALVTGFMEATPAQPFYAPQARPEEFIAALAEAAIDGETRLQFNALLLRAAGETILIDAGPGANVPAPYSLVATLAQLGVAPAGVDTVLLTHAHFDHCDGLLDTQNRPVFTRATHYCLAEEIDFWTAPNPDLSRLRMKPDWLLPAARRTFKHIAFERLTAGVPFRDGITPLLAPGHTPGHMNLRIESKGETLYHIADLTHHAYLMLPHADWTIASDANEEQAAATRRAVFARLAADRTRVFGSHLPFPGLGRIVRVGERYRWVPELWNPEA